MAIPPLNPLWRESDREAIRTYAAIPVTESGIQHLVSALNSVAALSPTTVTQCRAWIDEATALEAAYAGKVADGRAHLDSAKTYEGLRPGAEPTREDMLRQVDVLQYDTETLYKVRITAGDGQMATANGASGARIADLQAKVLAAIGLSEMGYGASVGVLLRS
jgi:hypothetical protein